MTDTKPGWRRVRFGQMVTSAGATRKARGWSAVDDEVDRYVGLEHLDPNSLKIRRWGAPESVGENSDLRLFEPGDVILARRRIYQRKIGVAEFRGVASGHALVFRAIPDVVLPDFLPFFMQSDAFMGRADRFSAGSLSGTVNLSSLMAEEFDLPPLDEQASLARLMKAQSLLVDCLCDAASRAQAVLDSEQSELFPSHLARGPLLNEALTLTIDRVSVSGGRELQLAGVLSEGRGLCDQGTIDSSRTSYQVFHRLNVGWVVMRKLTAWEGPIAVVSREFEGYVVSPEFPTFTVNTRIARVDYLRELFRVPWFHHEMRRRCKGSVLRRMRLSPVDLLSIPFAFPSLSEQANTVEKMVAANSLKDECRRRHEQAVALLRSTLATLGGVA